MMGSVARKECLSVAVTFQMGSRGTGMLARLGSTPYGGGVDGKCGACGPRNAKNGGRSASGTASTSFSHATLELPTMLVV